MKIKKLMMTMLGALAIGLSSIGVISFKKISETHADSASLGEFSLSSVKSVDVFNDPTNPNHMVFFWVSGTDYPDVDGEACDQQKIPASILNEVCNFSTHLLMDGATPNIITSEVYLNMWQRHPVFTLMPEGNANHSNLVMRKGFRIPSYSYIKGGTPSYYEADKDYLLTRTGNSRVHQEFNDWEVSEFVAGAAKIEKVESYVDNANEFLTFTLSGPEIDYPMQSGVGNFHFSMDNVSTLLPNFKEKVKLYDGSGNLLSYDFAHLLTIDLWTRYPTISVGLDLLPQARKITIEDGLVLPSYAKYNNDTSSALYDGYTTTNSLSVKLDDSVEHTQASILVWENDEIQEIGVVSMANLFTQHPFADDNANEFAIFQFSTPTDFASVPVLKWDSNKYPLFTNTATHFIAYDENDSIITTAQNKILDVYFNWYGKTNSISIMIEGLAAARRIELKAGLIFPSYAYYMGNVQSDTYGYYSLDDDYDFIIKSGHTHTQDSINEWSLPSCQIEFYDENDTMIESLSEEAECGKTYTLPGPISKRGYDGTWVVVEPVGLTIMNNTLTIPNNPTIIKIKMSYAKRTYYLSFEGVEVEPIAIQIGDAIPSLPSIPLVTGKTGMWMVDNEVIKEGDIWNYDENKVATAYYEDAICTITFVSNGGNEIEPIEIIYNNPAETLPIPEKEGYFFAGWYEDETLTKQFVEGDIVTKDLVLYASWLIKCTVHFDTNGGSSIEDIIVGKGNTISTPVTPTKAGYIFDGWTLNGNDFDFSTPIEEDITLVAKWKVDPFSSSTPSSVDPAPSTNNNVNIGLVIAIVAASFILLGGIVSLIFILLRKRK